MGKEEFLLFLFCVIIGSLLLLFKFGDKIFYNDDALKAKDTVLKIEKDSNKKSSKEFSSDTNKNEITSLDLIEDSEKVSDVKQNKNIIDEDAILRYENEKLKNSIMRFPNANPARAVNNYNFAKNVEKDNPVKKRDNYDNMVYVQSGDILFDDTKIFVKAFFIDKYEVTVGKYKELKKNYIPPKGFENENFPAVNISYYDAEQYAKSINKRLPTEYEWIRAARGNTNNIYSFGNRFDISKDRIGVSWDEGPAEVGSYMPNLLGIYDMSGNVWEWTSTKSNDIINNKGDNYFVLKGGCWYNSVENSKIDFRRFENGNFVSYDIGFRCVKDSY